MILPPNVYRIHQAENFGVNILILIGLYKIMKQKFINHHYVIIHLLYIALSLSVPERNHVQYNQERFYNNKQL